MKKIILIHKKEGETPLEALEDFRRKNKKYKNVKMTYAGRLDPMASGLLLVLAGEEVKKKEKYFTGKFLQRYPMYSSKTVSGKQLFEYARAGEEIEAPEREVDVSYLHLKKIRKVKAENLL